MNKEQIRFFKLYSARTAAGDRKDIQLFDHIRKNGKDYDDHKAFSKIYNGNDKNAFYRLKNRLLSDLNKSLSIQHFEDNDFIYTCHMLALYKFFSQKNNWKEAHFYLKKAEGCAIAIESPELLDIIYGEYIRLSHEALLINPEQYIKKRKINLEQLTQLRAIDDLLAAVTYRLKITQNLSSGNSDLLDLLKNSIDDFIKDKDLKKSPTLRFRLYKAVSQLLLQRHDYAALEDYLLSIYTEFEKEKMFTRDNHDTKLQMLTYLVNTFFKNNKLKQSLQYAEKLKNSMEEFHHLLYDKYIFFYYNAQVINYSQLNPTKAIEILEDLKDNEKIKSNSFYHLFVYLNLAVIYFTLKNYKESARNLTRLYLLEGYKSAEPSLRLKIRVAEMIIRFQLGDTEILGTKLTQIHKDFRSLLTGKEHLNEKEILALFPLLIHHDSTSRKKLKQQIMKFLETNSENSKGDTEVINYRNWLLSLQRN
jgi:hypothetical protein